MQAIAKLQMYILKKLYKVSKKKITFSFLLLLLNFKLKIIIECNVKDL